MPSKSRPAASRGTGEKNRHHSPRVDDALAKLRSMGLLDKRVTFGKRQAQRIVKQMEGIVSGELKAVKVTAKAAADLKGHVRETSKARGVRKGFVVVDADADVVTRKGGKGGGATTGIVRSQHGVVVPVDLTGGLTIEQQAERLFRDLAPGDMVGFGLDTGAGPDGGTPYNSRRLFRDAKSLAAYLMAYSDAKAGNLPNVVIFGVGKSKVPTYIRDAKVRAGAAKAAAQARSRAKRRKRLANGRNS